MFRSILIAVISVLKLSGCSPSNPVNRNAPGGPRCYSCPSVEEPYLCNVTTQCGHDEQCYTDEYSTNGGTNIFSVGCRRISECYTAIVQRSVSSKRDVKPLKCVECCHGNLCNRGGCSAGLGKSNVCYNCRFIKDPRRCQHETICQGDEHCFIEKVLTQIYDIKYIQGCVENAECETLRQFGPIVGKRDTAISTLCASCCYGDKCNDVCSPQGFTSTTQRTSSATSTHGIYRTTSTPMIEDTTVGETTNAELHTIPSVTKDTTYGMSNTSPLMTEDTTVVDTAQSEAYTSHSVTKDTTVFETSGMPDTSHSMDKDTTTVDTTNGIHFSPLPKSTTPAFSTIGHTVTTSPSTSTTASPSTSTTASPSTSTTASPSTSTTASPSTSTTTSPSTSTTASPSTSTTASPSTSTTTSPSTSTTASPSTSTTTSPSTSTTASPSTSTTTSPSTSTTTSPSTSTTASPSTSTTTSPPTSTTTSALTLTVCHKECSGAIECEGTDVQLCTSPTPYCFTVLDKHASGSYNISKRCADRNTCNDKWLKQTSGDNRCLFFNPSIKDTFSCFYCCTTHKCNMQSFPPYMSSLFRETDKL
ncbi:mucin-5AC-like isoform X5 [Haliotis rubra]|uniref:mucin-5AC-like isoform X5 n=1 Tax=Haliotis rubra TaxID=36100 RepID=UPI001EE5C70D|nr:mucin-5AC-like isoform X5 [Haliotis rubra]